MLKPKIPQITKMADMVGKTITAFETSWDSETIVIVVGADGYCVTDQTRGYDGDRHDLGISHDHPRALLHDFSPADLLRLGIIDEAEAIDYQRRREIEEAELGALKAKSRIAELRRLIAQYPGEAREAIDAG